MVYVCVLCCVSERKREKVHSFSFPLVSSYTVHWTFSRWLSEELPKLLIYHFPGESKHLCRCCVFFGFLFFLSGTLSSGKRGASSRHKTISWKKKLNANYAFPLNATADKEIHTNTDTRYIRLFFQLLFSQDSSSGAERWGKVLCRGPLRLRIFKKIYSKKDEETILKKITC